MGGSACGILQSPIAAATETSVGGATSIPHQTVSRQTGAVPAFCDYRHSLAEDTIVSEEADKIAGEVAVEVENLYREETFTDLRVAGIRRLTPVNTDGSPDSSREVLFIGETQLLSPRGPLPIQCPIEAKNLEEAIEKFPEAVNRAVEAIIDEARELQRQESSRIVVPGGPLGGGGLPGGGKIGLG